MLRKYEPVVLAVLTVVATVLMENHHRVDLTFSEPGDRQPTISACQTGPGWSRFALTTAAAAQGEAALLVYGNRDDAMDACAAAFRTYSAASGVEPFAVP